MNVHTLIVHITKPGHSIPQFIGGRAAVLLREQLPESNSRRGWIDSGPWRLITPQIMVLEIYAPNSVRANDVLTAVNRAIKEYLPELSALDWVTSYFSTTACINQDI